MKSIFMLIISLGLISFLQAQNPPAKSPAVTAKETLSKGTEVTINYGQPSLNGRTIGKDVEPMPGKVWRAGANAATVFEVSKNVRVQGKDLPAGKYGFFVIDNGSEWTLIFNKVHNQWGAYEYKEASDALRVSAKVKKADPAAAKLTYQISKDGNVTIQWGEKEVRFKIDE